MESRSTRLAIPALAIGLVVQLVALPLPGNEDVVTFRKWAIYALDRGVVGAYRADPGVAQISVPDYPPLAVVALAGAAKATFLATGSLHESAPALSVAIKGLTVVATIISVLLVRIGATAGSGSATATAAAVMVWVNPALIVNGPVLGSLDSLCWVFGVAAVFSASRTRFSVAAVLGVCSAMVKPQGIFFLLPVVAAAWGDWPAVKRAVAAATATALIVVAPFVVVSGADSFARAMAVNMLDDTLSGQALNLWALVSLGFDIARHGEGVFSEPLTWMRASQFADATGVGPRLPMALAVMGFAAWFGWVARGLTALPVVAAYGALVVHAYFSIAISVHENHLVFAVVLLGLVAAFEHSYRWMFVAISGLTAANMVLFYGLGTGAPGLAHTGWIFAAVLVLSLANLLLLVVHARLFLALVPHRPQRT